MNNIYILNGNIASNQFQISVVPFYFQEYHEDNGTTEWNWFSETDTTFEELNKKFQYNTPHIIGLSVYVWNYKYLYSLAKKIKNHYPDALIVAGGPQVAYDFEENFLQSHWFIDLIVTDQGEETFSNLLDNYVIGDPYCTPGIIYRGIDGHRTENPKSKLKTSRNWQSRWVIKYQDQIRNSVKRIKNISKNGQVGIIYETTRGCPYQCTYCDWGGGTYTKTKKKSMFVVKQELEILAQLGIEHLTFGDANWGMYPDDIEISKYIVELNKKYRYPKLVSFDTSKNNHDRNIEILRIFSKAKLLSAGFLSFQDTNDDVLSNVKRITPNWNKQIKAAIELNKETGIHWHAVMIYGLPGQTVETIKDTIIDLLEVGSQTGCIYPKYSHLMVLPNSPLAREPIRSQQKIKHMYRKILYNMYPINPKNQEIYDKYIQYGLPVAKMNSSEEMCLIQSTYSYDSSFISKVALTTTILATLQAHYLIQPYYDCIADEKIKDFNRYLVDSIFDENGKIHNIFKTVYTTHKNWVNGIQELLEIDLREDFEFTVQFETAIRFLVLENINEISQALVDIGDELDINLHCVHSWLPKFTLNSDYFPGKIVEYFDHSANEILKYKLLDTVVPNEPTSVSIEWHNYEGIHKQQTMLFQCCLSRNFPRLSQHYEKYL